MYSISLQVRLKEPFVLQYRDEVLIDQGLRMVYHSNDVFVGAPFGARGRKDRNAECHNDEGSFHADSFGKKLPCSVPYCRIWDKYPQRRRP